MNPRADRMLYKAEAILLTMVVVPLARAELVWWYAAILGLALIAGWFTTIHRRRPWIGERAGNVIALGALALLLLECRWLGETPAVMGLSHFMILVCASKMLQRRTARDHAQVLVLSLLLLTVAAIVSGNLWFPLTLAIYLTVGLGALMRYHLYLEEQRQRRHNARIGGDAVAKDEQVHHLSVTGPTAALAGVAVGIGVVVFAAFPRIGAGMFGELGATSRSPAVTGFAERVDFQSVGPIRESNRTLMRVRLETAKGIPYQTAAPLYFRGTVVDQYSRRTRGRGGWAWWRGDRGDLHLRLIRLERDHHGERVADLLPDDDDEPDPDQIVQHYYLEPHHEGCLFTCYPALEIRSHDVSDIRKCVEDQVLVTARPTNEAIRYTVSSAVTMSPSLADRLADERGQPRDPPVHRPSSRLDRESEILELTARLSGNLGNLDDPTERLAFVRRLESYLRSDEFSYTLNPPPLVRGREPIGRFLFETRRGHCEYFAAALAIMCQLNNIPARVVSGYRTGEYNPVGDFYLVKARHAHAWVEVYIPGKDWVTFDPTPAADESDVQAGLWLLRARRYFDYFQFQWANLVVAYDADMRREMIESFQAWLRRPSRDQRTGVGAVVAFVRELFGWRLHLSLRERLVYWVFSLLVVVLAVLIVYIFVRVVSWSTRVLLDLAEAQARQSRPGPQVDFYLQFLRRLQALGIRRPADQTPAEFARDLAARHPALGPASEVVQAYYEVAFGDHALDSDRRRRIDTFLARLKKADIPAQAT
jgi:hypothetical protein